METKKGIINNNAFVCGDYETLARVAECLDALGIEVELSKCLDFEDHSGELFITKK